MGEKLKTRCRDSRLSGRSHLQSTIHELRPTALEAKFTHRGDFSCSRIDSPFEFASVMHRDLEVNQRKLRIRFLGWSGNANRGLFEIEGCGSTLNISHCDAEGE